MFGTSRRARAARIARTEAGAASNGARNIEHNREGVTETKWATSKDEHVRKSPVAGGVEGHYGLDGKRTPIKKTFVKGITLRYPLDRAAPPGWIVNCRCVAMPTKRKKKSIVQFVVDRLRRLERERTAA